MPHPYAINRMNRSKKNDASIKTKSRDATLAPWCLAKATTLECEVVIGWLEISLISSNLEVSITGGGGWKIERIYHSLVSGLQNALVDILISDCILFFLCDIHARMPAEI